MNYIKNFIMFKESLLVSFNYLLNSINAIKINLKFLNNFNLDLKSLDKNVDFIDILSKNNLKKSDMQLSTDYETFVGKCRFMFIYDKKATELENPYYLLLQSYGQNKWQITKIYKINDDIKKFYDQLSSKTIEIEDNGERFIYVTSDSTTWDLKSIKETDVYKRSFRREDLERVIQDRKAKVKII